MFDKKIILLISFLLVTSSSYIIFHRKKNNDNGVNIVDNSDVLNEEESINKDAESSSSLLFVIIIVIVIIIIAAAIFFFIFYCIKINKEDKIFKEYKRFKEVKKNKEEIEEIKLKKKDPLHNQVLLFVKDIQDAYSKINSNDYVQKKYIIDFFYHYANDKLKNPYQENNKTVYRFNFQEHLKLFSKILSRFFEAVISDEAYQDNVFRNSGEEERKRVFYIFIATIIEPFFEAIQKKIYEGQDHTFLFVHQSGKDEGNFCKEFYNAVFSIITSEKPVSVFLYEITNNENIPFFLIFNRLIKEYFKFNFVPEEIS